MFGHAFYQFIFTATVLALVSALPAEDLEARASCVVDSVSAASSISSCSAVTINAFTVPSGSKLDDVFSSECLLADIRTLQVP